MSCTRSITLAAIFLELFPFVTFSCPDNNSYSTHTIGMKLHIWIDLDERNYHAKVHNSGSNIIGVIPHCHFFMFLLLYFAMTQAELMLLK